MSVSLSSDYLRIRKLTIIEYLGPLCFVLTQDPRVIQKTKCSFSILFYFVWDFIYLFLERAEGREKERERNIDVWLPLTWPPWGPGLQPRRVLWLRIELGPFGSQGSARSTDLHQPGLILYFNNFNFFLLTIP